jgi:nucleotide-binding universal stress UspA family protein
MFKSILCPVDFSDRSRGAAHAARAFARRFGSEVVALHIAPDGDPAHVAEAEQKLAAFVRYDLEGCSVSSFVETGDTAERILQVAVDRRIEMIVMATHGLSPFRRFELGSVATKVLHLSPCPVWTGPHLEGWPALDAMPLRVIVCALDFGPRSCSALHWASCLAKEFHAKLTLAHVVRPDEREHRFEAPEETMLRQKEHMTTRADVRILEGMPASRLSELADEVAADLVVIGRTRASSTRLGANAYAIISHSPCPVLSA